MSISQQIHDAHRRGFSHCVYLLLRPNGIPFYVGKGKRKIGKTQRPHQHVLEIQWKRSSNNPFKDRVITKIVESGQEVGIQIDSFHIDDSSAMQREESLIREFGRMGVTGESGILANLSIGGPSHAGARHSEAARKRMSETRKRLLASPDGRRLVKEHADAIRGRRHTPEHKAKIAAGLTGRPCSEETRRKIGAANSRNSATRLTADVRERISRTLQGTIQSRETKLRRSASRGFRLLFNGDFVLHCELADRLGICGSTLKRWIDSGREISGLTIVRDLAGAA